jgi:hypothetical protein
MRSRVTQYGLNAIPGLGVFVMFGTVLFLDNGNWARLPVWLFVVCQVVIWTGFARILWIKRKARR